ncbi:sigma factor [Streptosporangium sandarakinum]|uniref:sigma factor n=1 Tax=Streptosporangium sandarakinum TaxID=1260955 RepID=UPI0034416D59
MIAPRLDPGAGPGTGGGPPALDFDRIFDDHFTGIHRYVARRLDVDAADDLAAETFLRAFRDRHRFDAARGEVRPWMYGIATNLLAKHRRSEIRRWRALARTAVRDTAGHHGGHAEGHEDAVTEKVAVGRVTGRLAGAPAGLAEPTFAGLEALPRDAGTLLERFKAIRRGDRSPSRELDRSFSAVSLLNLPSPPDLRAAALRVLAGLPGTRAVGEITDPLGRPGVAVRINADETGETAMGDATAPIDYRIVLDPVTGEMTGECSTVVRDTEGVAAGTVIGYAAYTEQGWTGERPERPEGCKEGSVG